MKTVYIVPAETELGCRCRIVAAEQAIPNPRDDYRQHPERWPEVGLMNAQGRLVCLRASPEIVKDVQSSEPLMAGMVFHYPEKDQSC